MSLSLPLRGDRFVGTPVINVFDNLLPDDAQIRRRLAERVGAGGTDAFSLLAAIGHDCVGALQFLPDGVDPGVAGSTDGRPVDDGEIADILANLGSAPLGIGADEAFRISIAGAQEKTALMRKDGRWFKPAGTAATTHILKPQIGRLANGIDISESVENEFFCLKLMGGFGLPVASAEIAEFAGKRTLVVERFDRLWTRDRRLLRLPQEDMCRSRHCRVEEIGPRHFVETADLAGVGKPVMQAIIEDLAESATRVVAEVTADLPAGFPEPLVTSIAAAVARRARLCAEAALR